MRKAGSIEEALFDYLVYIIKLFLTANNASSTIIADPDHARFIWRIRNWNPPEEGNRRELLNRENNKVTKKKVCVSDQYLIHYQIEDIDRTISKKVVTIITVYGHGSTVQVKPGVPRATGGQLTLSNRVSSLSDALHVLTARRVFALSSRIATTSEPGTASGLRGYAIYITNSDATLTNKEERKIQQSLSIFLLRIYFETLPPLELFSWCLEYVCQRKRADRTAVRVCCKQIDDSTCPHWTPTQSRYF